MRRCVGEEFLIGKSDEALEWAAWGSDGISVPGGDQAARRCGT